MKYSDKKFFINSLKYIINKNKNLCCAQYKSIVR